MPVLTLGGPRPPTAKELLALRRRLSRINAAGFDKHLEDVAAHLRRWERPGGHLALRGLRIRPGFSYRTDGVAGDSSDRKAPPRAQRPPATAISSGQGSVLRFELTMLALVQAYRKPGARARVAELGMTVTGSTRERGWSDLIATQPSDSLKGGVLMTSRDKRARTVRSALGTLDQGGLVTLPGLPGERHRFEHFVLLDEEGTPALGERQEYVVPTATEAQFAMPPGFVLNNWVHVLEDSEIAVLLMVACGRGGWDESGSMAFPGEVRLRRYGIHRDPYSRARKTLDWLGLLDVTEVGRHDDGRAEDDERMLHRLRLIPQAFDEPALPAMRTMLRKQIGDR